MTHLEFIAARLRGLVAAARFALCRLNRIQFEAPWRPHRGGC